jgi:hypothetical protein
VRDVKDLRHIGIRVALLGNGKEARVAHDMGICHDVATRDDESGADTRGYLSWAPGVL